LGRWPATNFSKFDNRNISYVMGAKADPNIPDAILAADRNLPGCSCWWEEIRRIPKPPEDQSLWDFGLHERKGNLLFSDGRVEESNDANVRSQESVAEDLVYPQVPSSGGGIGGPGASVPDTPDSPSLSLNSKGKSISQPNFNSAQSGQKASAIGGDRIHFPAVSPGTNGSVAGSNANPKMAVQPPSSHGSRKIFTKTYSAPDDVQIPPATTGMVPAASSERAIAPGDPNRFMSPSNRHVAKLLQHLFLWSYLFLLLLLLLYIAYKLWQREQAKKRRRELARIEQQARESVLASDESFR
jgi:hypothetical protein